MQGLRREVQRSEERIREEIADNGKQIQGLRKDHESVVSRLEVLEKKAAQGISTTVGDSSGGPGDRHKFTLLFGGWGREC